MSDDPLQRLRTRAMSTSGRALRIPLLIAGAALWVLALSEIGQTWETARLASSYEPPARIGDLVSATLLTGQVFFGTLDAVSRTTIRLRDVFYARLPEPANRAPDEEGGDRTPVILRREANEWTRADLMAIPTDRINFMETVGVDSRIARFISDARSRPVTTPPEQQGVNPANPASATPPASSKP